MLENIFKDLTWGQGTLGVIGVLILLDFVSKLVTSAKIRKLGARAPARSTWLPFGIDLAYRGVVSVMRNNTYEFFTEGENCPTLEKRAADDTYRHETLCQSKQAVYS
jgi:hypothetical protein